MKEIRDIVKACKEAFRLGKKTALATVVHIKGSSYRQPGARMLITEDGHLTGAISGGCLEGDALRKAMLAISQGRNKLVTYDTTDEDDLKFGVQLGCNGIVHILFEPIQESNKTNAIYLLERLVSKRQTGVLVTLFSLQDGQQQGTSLLYQNDGIESYLPHSFNMQMQIEEEAREALKNNLSAIKFYHNEGQSFNALIEVIPPSIAVVIAGAGNDALPLVQITSILGWHTTIVDGRKSHATEQRFPMADKIIVAKAEEVIPHIVIDAQTVFLLMTHNYNYDLALLKHLVAKECTYIGILGPKSKLERMFTELNDQNIPLSEDCRSKIHSPVGLDIGAETAEEIAVSIVAEIKAVFAGGKGGSLKNKAISIHHRPSQVISVHE